MKRFLNLTLICAVIATLASCKIKDVPSITLEQTNYTVTAEGGQLTIPVSSTGIDNARVDYRESYYEWTTDEQGNKTPAQGWITIERIINDYEPQTRELPSFSEGVELTIAPNTSVVDRQANLILRSFNKEAVVSITQVAKLPVSEE